MKNTQESGNKAAETNKDRQGQKTHEQAGTKGGHAQSHPSSKETTRERGRGENDDEDDSSGGNARKSVGYTQSDENEDERVLEASSERQGNQRSQGSGRSSQGGSQSHGSSHSQSSGRSQNDGRSQNGNQRSKDK